MSPLCCTHTHKHTPPDTHTHTHKRNRGFQIINLCSYHPLNPPPLLYCPHSLWQSHGCLPWPTHPLRARSVFVYLCEGLCVRVCVWECVCVCVCEWISQVCLQARYVFVLVLCASVCAYFTFVCACVCQSVFMSLHRRRQLSRRSFSVAQDGLLFPLLNECGHLWPKPPPNVFEWSDLSVSSMCLGFIPTCT